MFATVGVLRHFTAGLVILTIFAVYGDSRAQEGSNPMKGRSHSLYKGSQALQFRIANNFVLSDFQGVALSGKKHISDNNAIRLGANLYFESSNSDEDTRTMYTDTSFTSSDGDRNIQRLVLDLQYIHYPRLERAIKFYWGTGPSLQFNRNIAKTDYYDSDDDTTFTLKNEIKSWGAGGSGILGVEWFATSNISFHTEYILSILYEWEKIRDDSLSGSTFNSVSRKTNGFQIYTSNVRFGLSLYF